MFPLDKSDFITDKADTLSGSFLSGEIAGAEYWGKYFKYIEKIRDLRPQMKEDICHILECAGLIHDIGNPPFGHFGETAIREWFERNLPKLAFHGRQVRRYLNEQMKQDLYHFEGNAQASTGDKTAFLVDEHGMNLTYALLNTIVKYPVLSDQDRSGKRKYQREKDGILLCGREDLPERLTQATGAGT